MNLPLSFRPFPRALALAGFALIALTASAATRTVSSLSALQSAINAAAPGDTITLKNGTYATSATLTVARAGNAAAPITIAAESVGGVTLTGKAGFKFTSPAAHVTVAGFVFAHAAGQTVIAAGADHCRFTRCVFECTGDGPYLVVTGDRAEVDRCEFRNKKTLGNMISVTGIGAQVARHLWIHHNYFHDFANAGGNGAETIRFGLSGLSMSTGSGLVEHNLFVRCIGENELISNKSCGNTYRYNTLLDSPGAQLTLRHGNDCFVYGNIFRGTDGLRIFGDRHQVFSNYFEDNTRAINLGNGDGEVADGAKLTCHDRPDHCVIAFNTFIENEITYQMDNRKDGMGATHTTFTNNLIQGGGKVVVIGGPNQGAIYRGNVVTNSGPGRRGGFPSVESSIAGGFISDYPPLVADAHGIKHYAPGAPAPGGALGDYASIIFDQDGQPRGAAKTVGADQPSSAPIIAHFLTPADVGPASR